MGFHYLEKNNEISTQIGKAGLPTGQNIDLKLLLLQVTHLRSERAIRVGMGNLNALSQASYQGIALVGQLLCETVSYNTGRACCKAQSIATRMAMPGHWREAKTPSTPPQQLPHPTASQYVRPDPLPKRCTQGFTLENPPADNEGVHKHLIYMDF